MPALFLSLSQAGSDLSQEETTCLAQLELNVWPWIFAGEGSRQDQVTGTWCVGVTFRICLVLGGIYRNGKEPGTDSTRCMPLN